MHELAVRRLVCEGCWQRHFSTSGYQDLCEKNSRDDRVSYTVDLSSIRQGATRGCTWCRLILAVKDESDSQNDADAERASCAALEISFGSGRVHEDFSPVGNNRFRIWVDGSLTPLTFFTNSDSVAAERITARELETEVFSDAAHNQIQSWLRQCVDHGDCPQRLSAKLPSRVIDVSSSGGLNKSRLLVTDHIHGQYVALSYCWGSAQTGITVLDNLSSRTQAIDESLLSKTVRDAISVTRAIGHSYLWVDSICIVQDSQEDKERELASMDSIYHNAPVTIVAASAASSEDGFLDDRTLPTAGFMIPFWATNDSIATVYARPEGYYNSRDDPIHSRAWTFQEAWLSPRLLIYAGHTLQYHCNTHFVNWGNSLNLQVGCTVNHISRDMLRNLAQVEPTKYLPPWVSLWMSAITDYSSRDLTHACDRLPALSGLARIFYTFHGLAYAAGLWTGDYLAIMLLWQTVGRGVMLPNEYAPSWTWASIQDPVVYRTGLYDDPTDPYTYLVVTTNCDVLTETLPFGRITAGYLHVRTRLRIGVCVAPQWIAWTAEAAADQDHAQHINASFDRMPEADEIVVSCIALVQSYSDSTSTKIAAIHGLLLAHTAKGDAYSRMGVFFGASEEDFDDIEPVELRIE